MTKSIHNENQDAQSDHDNVIASKLDDNHVTAAQANEAHHKHDVPAKSADVLDTENRKDSSEFFLTDEIDVKSHGYKLAVTAFWLKHRHKQIISDNEGVDFITTATILRGLKRHSVLGGMLNSSNGIPDITEEDVAAVVGFGGWELPWIDSEQGIAYDLNYTQATLRDRAAVRVHISRAELGDHLKAA